MPYHKKELPPKRLLSLGTTLFELCLVLSLIGLVLFTLSLSLQVSRRHRVWVELDRLYTVIRYLQRMALIEGKIYKLKFDIEGGSYSADRVWKLGSSVYFGVPHRFHGQRIKGPPGKPKKEISHGCSWSKDTLEIYPTGSLSAGALYLTDTAGSCVYALTIDASEVTALRRYYYDRTWKLVE